MSEIHVPEWEIVHSTDHSSTERFKIPGGWLYHVTSSKLKIGNTVFVPDVDLERYAEHLKTAYNQGYQAGQEEMSIQNRQKCAVEAPLPFVREEIAVQENIVLEKGEYEIMYGDIESNHSMLSRYYAKEPISLKSLYRTGFSIRSVIRTK
jgi:hypothetical protein